MKKHSMEYFLKLAERSNWCLPSSVSWKVVREVVLLRDNKKCQFPEHEPNGDKKLHVHHIRYPEWDLRDLVTLCEDCHFKQPKQTFEKELQNVPIKEWERQVGLIGWSKTKTFKVSKKLGSILDEDKHILSED